jgi:hypothetical protein
MIQTSFPPGAAGGRAIAGLIHLEDVRDRACPACSASCDKQLLGIRLFSRGGVPTILNVLGRGPGGLCNAAAFAASQGSSGTHESVVPEDRLALAPITSTALEA